MPEQPITRDQIANISPVDTTVIFTIDEPPTGEWGKFTLADLSAYIASSQITREEFTNLTTGTSVTLSVTPTSIVSIKRNGVEATGGDYTVAGATITFNEAFGPSPGATGSESVTVIYQ